MGRIVPASRDPYETDDPAHLGYHDRNRRTGRMAGQVRVRALRDAAVDYLFVSRNEMVAILDGTGWRVKRFIDAEGPRYVAIIEKGRS